MSPEQERERRLRPMLVLIALLLGAALTGSVALAGLPTGNTQAPASQGQQITAQQVAVPVIKLPKSAQTLPASAVVRAQVLDVNIYEYDMVKAGAQPVAPALGPDGKELPVGAMPRPNAPEGNALGTQNAFMSLSHEVAPTSTSLAVTTVSTGFQPFEAVLFSLNGGSPSYFPANSTGALFVSISTGTGAGEIYIQARGLYSGKVAGGVFRSRVGHPRIPGVAVGPHAVIPGGGEPIYMFGSQYPPLTDVNFARDDAVLGTFPTDTLGRTLVIIVTVAAGPDGSAVYNTYGVTNTVGSLAGQSIEERADAGPPGIPLDPKGDRNVSAAFVDRPVLSSTVSTRAALVGEGFVPGETVTLTYLPGTILATQSADANGAVSFILETLPGDLNYKLQLSGTSGRRAYASLMADPNADNVPSSIVAPSRSNSTGTVKYLFTRFAPSSTGTIFVDSISAGGATTDAQGSGAVLVGKPTNTRITHSVAFVTAAQEAIAPLMLTGSGTITGTIRDAVSGQLIKGTVRVTGVPDAITQNDPAMSGVYTLTLAAGTYTLTFTPSGCYYGQTMTNVVVAPDSANTVNATLARSGTDAFGYACYDNAGAAYVAATNVVTNTFNNENFPFTLPFSVNYYGVTTDTGTINGNGFATLGIINTVTGSANACIPGTATPNGTLAVSWDDLVNSTSPATGIYTDVIGTAPNRRFVIEWRDFIHLADTVTNTVQVQIEETTGDIYMVYPTFNVGRSDGRESTMGIENLTGTIAKQYQCNTGTALSQETNNYVWRGNSVRYYNMGSVSTATVTNTPGPTNTPVNTATGTATPSICGSDANYTVISTTATLDPGTLDIGNHGDDVVTNVALPFAYTFYGQTFTAANVSSNGNVQFTSASTTFSNVCLPSTILNNVILPYWDDLRTDGAAGAAGIFTSMTGVAPNRIFNIEWRTCIRTGASPCAAIDTNFEARLYEGQSRVDFVYGPLLQNGSGATIGVQKGTGARFTQYSCNTASVGNGGALIFTQPPCATATPGGPTETSTATTTGTNTPTSTGTNVAASFTPVLLATGTNTVAPSATSTPCPFGYAVSFAAPVSYPVGTNSLSVAVGDFNTDGKPDLAVANYGSNNVSVLLNNGTGGFNPATNYPVSSNPRSVAVGDFNTDGKPDLAVANYGSNNVSVLLNNGTGGFNPATNYPVSSNPPSVAVGDFNTDGKPDLAVANYFSADVSVLLNNGTGGFNPATNYSAGSGPYSVAVGDFNTDTKPDLAVANYASNNVSVLLNNGTGGFNPATNYPAGTNPISVAVGDFNSDTKPDLAVANQGSNNVSVLLNNGTGGFNPATNYPAGQTTNSVAVGDFNIDGRPDLVVGNAGGSLSVLLNNGTGGFNPATSYNPGNGTAGVAVGDFNTDGKPDLAVANGGSSTVSVLLNNGGCIMPTATATSTATRTATNTPIPTGTNTPGIPTPIPTGTNTALPTATTTNTVVPSATRTSTVAATATCSPTGGTYRILIVHADPTNSMTMLQSELQAEPNVASVTLFDASAGTPTLAQLQANEIVVAMSNSPYQDPVTLGNNLADYQDGGGIVVAAFGSFYNSGNYPIQGRWQTGGYSPYTYSTLIDSAATTLGTHDPTHPLMQGVTTLNAGVRLVVAPAAGATQVAAYADGDSAVAFKTTSGRTAVGLPVYLGNAANRGTGQYARVIVNAGRWLRPAVPCASVTATTNTAVPTSTRTNTAVVPPTNTNTAVVPPTNTNTAVVPPTNTNTAVVPPTNTNTAIVPTNTNTAVVPPTSTSTATTPPVATATVCVMPFTDVDIYNPFYIYIKCLYCRGIISGYADNTFRPYNDITRGQTAKIVSNSAGFSEPVSGQRYTDVPTTHTFYVWIMRLTNRNIATGYNTLAECPTGVPCFRPENPVTRGQLAKMASNAAGFSDVPPAGTLTFTDVPPGSTFYLFIERLARRGIINGYPCGVDPNEPCDAQRRPYYRPNHNITRGQASKIVANTFFPVNCTPGTPAILPGR